MKRLFASMSLVISGTIIGGMIVWLGEPLYTQLFEPPGIDDSFMGLVWLVRLVGGMMVGASTATLIALVDFIQHKTEGRC